MVGICVVALIVYVFGLPAFTLGSMLYAKRKALLKNPHWLSTLGLFYKKYGKMLNPK